MQLECPECPEVGGSSASLVRCAQIPLVRGEPTQSALHSTALNKQTETVPGASSHTSASDADADLGGREVKPLPFCADNPSSRPQ